jgi:hypothetical protein
MKNLFEFKVRFRTLVVIALVIGLLIAVWLNPEPTGQNDPWMYPQQQGIIN